MLPMQQCHTYSAAQFVRKPGANHMSLADAEVVAGAASMAGSSATRAISRAAVDVGMMVAIARPREGERDERLRAVASCS